MLVYSGLFLSEDAGIQKIFKEKANAGVRVRILLGDPASQVVADRGEDEGVGDAQAAKIRNALARPGCDLAAAQTADHASGQDPSTRPGARHRTRGS